MAYQLGFESQKVYGQVHLDLQRLIDELIKHIDFMVREGYRSPEEQQRAFDEKRSKAKPGQSKHNSQPSQAVHLIPYPIPNPDKALTERIDYTHFAGAVKLMALVLGVKLRWGGDWNNNWKTGDNRFNDLAHYELMD